jgi:hypothetical protein
MPRPLSAKAMLTARTTTTLRWRCTANRGSRGTKSQSGRNAGCGQGRATSNHFPEYCDQSVICRSSLGQIGNELSTGARPEPLLWNLMWPIAGLPMAAFRPTTAANYERYVRQDIVPSELGEMRLTEIRRSHVNAWIANLAATRGPVTVRRALARLRMVFSAAVRDEIFQRTLH